MAIKAAGISCVIAKSFARIFYRNAINIGLPILECPAASEAIAEGDTVSIDFDTGVITDETTGQTFQAAPVPAVHPEHHRQGRPDEQLEMTPWPPLRGGSARRRWGRELPASSS